MGRHGVEGFGQLQRPGLQFAAQAVVDLAFGVQVALRLEVIEQCSRGGHAQRGQHAVVVFDGQVGEGVLGDRSEVDAQVGLDLVLEPLSEAGVAFFGDDGQDVQAFIAPAFALAVDAQTQPPTDGLAALTVAAHLAQHAYLEDVGIVPALAESRVREDEPQRFLLIQQLLLVAHDQVEAALGVFAAGGVLQIARGVDLRLGDLALAVTREVAVVGAVGLNRSFPEQGGAVIRVGRQLAVLFLEDHAVGAYRAGAVFAMDAVVIDAVDEEQAQDLDAQGPQHLLAVEMLLDGALDHATDNAAAIDVAMRFADPQPLHVAGQVQLHQRLAGRRPFDRADGDVAVDLALG